MSWCYRVVRVYPRRPSSDRKLRPWMGIREVYDDDRYTEHNSDAGGETLAELRDDLNCMLAALDKPILEVKDGKLVEWKGDE